MIDDVKKDPQTVTPEGQLVQKLICGVKVRYASTILDSRGMLCEVYNPDWGVHEAPLVYVYHFTIRPKTVKGWTVHYEQDDRLFVSQGVVKIVLYDDRPDSETYGMINEIHLGAEKRGLVVIPKYVFHAVQNVGSDDALIINMPTKAYNHASPDKYRLPANNDEIPYTFK